MIKQGGRQTGVAKSYLKQYQALIRKPAETIRNEGFALQDLIDWQKVESCPPYLLSSPHLTSPLLSSPLLRRIPAHLFMTPTSSLADSVLAVIPSTSADRK